jgi:DNA helicase-4
MSYEEANKKYNDGITWKKEAHAKYGTKLLTTNSADFSFFDIREKMKELLTQAGVPIVERTNEELYSLIIPKDSKREKTFIRLIATFITLLKASCKSIDNITSTALAADDKRSAFIIKGIFEPVYVLYEKELKTRKQIDFTDAIIKATELCNSQHSLEYDYIIVDEFQDISLDRYEFLKALRGTNKPAKLFCVGDDWQSIYRFSGSDMSLFNHFQDFFGPTDIKKIETTYRFGEPLVSLSSNFILRNSAQIKKTIHPYSEDVKTNIFFKAYDKLSFCDDIERIIENVPNDKSIFLLGRYSFDDYYLSFKYKCEKIGNRFYYNICGRRIEFLTVHKSKGLEADYVILFQCNKDIFGFPSQMSDDPVLNYVLTENDNFPFSEERRLFYVAMTRAKISTIVLYDKRFPSVFVDEFLHPEKITEKSYAKHPNAQKKWTRGEEAYLIKLHNSGRSVKYISQKMGRSQTSIIMRLGKLGVN